MTIVRVTGKAEVVFAVLKILAEKAGELTIGEIKRLRVGNNYEKDN